MTSMPKPSRLPDASETGDTSRGRVARFGERPAIALSELPGLMLDDNLVDELMLSEDPAFSLPVEIALRPSGNPRGSSAGMARARNEPAGVEDTLAIVASRGQQAWVSSRVAAGPVRGRDAHEVQPPAFLLDPPLTIRSSERAEHGIDPGTSRASMVASRAPSPSERGKEPHSMPSPARGIYAHLAPASIPVPDGRFGFAIGEGSSGLGSGDGGSDDEPLVRRLVERLRIDDGIERVRDWLWEIQPYLRGLASLVLPGWGQSLNEQPVKARFFRMSSFATLAAADLLLFRERVATVISLLVEVDASLIARCLAPVALAGLFLWLTAIYDALIVAKTRRECQSTRP